tara:strand:+ start:2191 stop:2814 length:624 start_codon:yes stop_codon:yes gene_type:complete
MLKTVRLYGELADFIGYKQLDAVINSTADAIKFLICNFDGLEAHMADRYYKVIVNDEDIDKKELHNPIGKSDIHIVPIITGAGSNTGKILLGAVLIGASFLFPGAGMFGTSGLFGAGEAVAGGFLTGVGTFTSAIGASLVLQGVSNMLFPLPEPPEFEDSEDPRISFSFSGIQNVSRAGVTHPIVYGEVVTGSVLISAGVTTNDVAT